MSKGCLNPKQQRFVLEYLVDHNGTQAAIRAGYSKATANEQASRMLANVNVQEELAAKEKSVIEPIENIIKSNAKQATARVQSILRGEYDSDRITPSEMLKAVDIAGRMAGLFVERVEHEVKAPAVINIRLLPAAGDENLIDIEKLKALDVKK